MPEDRVIACADAVMTVQRDYGDRKDRQRARFKYTIDDKGLDWVKAEIERVMGASFEEARRFSFASNGDTFGWQETPTAGSTARYSSRTAGSIRGCSMPFVMSPAFIEAPSA